MRSVPVGDPCLSGFRPDSERSVFPGTPALIAIHSLVDNPCPRQSLLCWRSVSWSFVRSCRSKN